MLQHPSTVQELHTGITGLMQEHGMGSKCFTRMLDHAIDLFESNGLGVEYYGYHNIIHELEVTFVTLLAATRDEEDWITGADLRHLFAAALLHDFDPQKSVDKPHEEKVIKYITLDRKLQDLLRDAGVDPEIIKAMIYRTIFPWEGDLKRDAEEEMRRLFNASQTARHDYSVREHFMQLGWFLSVADRIAGYSLGGFPKAIEMAKMNAHALRWHPSLIAQKSVSYFEYLMNNESYMYQRVMRHLPKSMRMNLMNNILSFLKLRELEIQVQADCIYENRRIVPVIEKMSTRTDPRFAESLLRIFDQLPKPLQLGRERFTESLGDPETILNTMRIGDSAGEIVGFAKGGPLESYELRPEIKDENRDKNNTVFLEPLAVKMGYWGLRGGSEARQMFIMQAVAKKFTYMTSFALRDVIRKRMEGYDKVEFVTLFDPEQWDYYRIRL